MQISAFKELTKAPQKGRVGKVKKSGHAWLVKEAGAGKITDG